MTDDQTHVNETPGPGQPPEAATGPTGESGGPSSAPGIVGAPTAADAPMPAAATATATASPGPNRMRLIAGLAAAALVLVLAAGAVFLLGGSTTPEALKYIPVDAAFVAEVRMDLPGDQLQKLGNVLAHFPGFADQSTLPAKIDEAFGQLVRNASGGGVDYLTDIKPWLNGPVFIAVSSESTQDGDSSSMLISATTNGGVDCAKTLEGQPVTQESYKGFTLLIAGRGEVACVSDGRFSLLGDPASVRKGLDTKAAGTGMNTSAAYTAARRQLAGEQLATFYMNGTRVGAMIPAPSLPIPALGTFAGQVPEWLILGLRAEDDAFLVDMVAAPVPLPSAAPSQLPLPPAHASVLAGLVPGDTLVYVENQGTGVALQNLFATLRTIPEVQAPLQVLEGMASPEDLVGWVEDAAIAISVDGTDPEAAKSPQVTVLLSAADAAAASDRVATVRSLLGLMALGGQGITMTDTTVHGHAVTTVTITDLGSLVPPGTVPDVGALPEGEISFSIAAIDRVIYLIVGEDLDQVIGIPSGAGLDGNDAFKQAGTRALPNSRMSMYVAAGAALDFVEAFLPPEIAAQFAAEAKPYVDPIEAIGAWSTSDATGTRFRAVVTVGP